MNKLAFILILYTMLFCSACQSTPEKEIIQNKSHSIDGILNQTPGIPSPSDTSEGIASAASEPYDAPTLFTEGWERSGVVISLDASVCAPQVSHIPIYEAKSIPYTKEQIQLLIQASVGDGELYDANHVVYTTEELLEALRWHYQFLEEVQNGTNTTYHGSIDQIQQTIAAYEQALSHAGEIKPLPVDPNILSATDGINAYAIVDGERQNLIAANELALFMRFCREPFSAGEPLGEHSELELAISRAEAAALAREFVEKLGYEDMEINAASEGLPLASEGAARGDATGYVFYFTRTIDGVALTFESTKCTSSLSLERESYAKPREYESIMLAVSERGVEEAEINGNLMIGDQIHQGVALMPFEQMLKSAQTLFFQRYSLAVFLEQLGAEKRVIHIDRIKFGYMQYAQKNSDSQMLIPVWDFFGYEESFAYDGSVVDKVLNSQRSYLTLNAVDGSIIDRQVGY